MNLRSPYPYWLLRHGIINSYPSLGCDTRAHVAVLGAGISGALVANELVRAGYDVVVVDRRHAGMGSTAASTSLLQYEIDVPLHKLIKLVGEKRATDSYLLCRKAIFDLKKICDHLKEPGIFTPKPSLQYASSKSDIKELEKEYTLRKQAGFSVQWLDATSIQNKFGIKKQAGLLSEEGAEADAYKLTHSILARRLKDGLRVYDNTEVVDIRHEKRGVTLLTANNKKIHAKLLVIACGYESQRYLPKKVGDLDATFAIASEPFNEKLFWYRNAMIWETATPYLYLRTTDDNRILAGGKDVPFSSPVKRDRMINQKAKSLEQSVRKLFPGLNFITDFKWAGTFGSTKDGLPYIGSIPQRPHTYFALGFGGNGTTFSVIAAQVILQLLNGKKKIDTRMFSFDR
jgi:glycine/D-amino acid oxidase-like deaminating enzyme